MNDKVQCQICNKWYKAITNSHVKTHDKSMDEYRSLFPDAELCSNETIEKCKLITPNNPNCGFQKGHTINDGSWTWNKGLTKDADERIKLYSEKLKGREFSIEHRSKLSLSAKGRPGLSGKDNPMFGRKMTEEEKTKRYNEDWHKKLINGIVNSNKRSVKKTRPEIKIEKILNVLSPLGWKYTGNRTYWIKFPHKRKNPDFTNLLTKQIIEVFGRYWHPDVNEEFELIAHYRKAGWQCLVLWEDEIDDLDSKFYQFLDLEEELFTPMSIYETGQNDD